MRHQRFIVLGLFASLLAGCGLQGSPRLSVADITLGPPEDGSAVVTLVIEARNSGDESLPLMSAEYEIEINGVSAYRGEWDAQATVPSGGSVRFELPAPIDASLVAPGSHASYSVRGGGIHPAGGAR